MDGYGGKDFEKRKVLRRETYSGKNWYDNDKRKTTADDKQKCVLCTEAKGNEQRKN